MMLRLPYPVLRDLFPRQWAAWRAAARRRPAVAPPAAREDRRRP